MLRGRRARDALPMRERWRQAIGAGQAVLDPFTAAELDCVTIDPKFLPEFVRGPVLQAVPPLFAAQPDGYHAVLASAAAGLERRGYLRPGVATPAGDDPIPDELGGWSADPANAASPRPVVLLGDLGIVTRMRAQPYWVAEAAAPADPGVADLVAGQWRLAARMYAAYRPQVAMIERPAPPNGDPPPCTLLFQHQAVLALVSWCGIEPSEMADRQQAAKAEQVPEVPAASVAAEFASIIRLTVAHPAGELVQLRTMIAANGRAAAGQGTTGQRRHWLLEGETAGRAVRASADQIGERVDTLIKPPGGGTR